jgi:hypothetical protein
LELNLPESKGIADASSGRWWTASKNKGKKNTQ